MKINNYNMKTLIIISILFTICFSTTNVLSQNTSMHRKCGTVEVMDAMFNTNPEMLISYQKTQTFINNYLREHQGQSSKSIIYIPVIFHVVLSPTQHAGFPDSRLVEQINALNRDFSGQNPHSMGTFPAYLKANTNIQFYVVTIDSIGNPTTGIERRDYTGATWGMGAGIKHYANGGLNAWNPNQYYNIWVGDLGTGFLGYAIVPVSPNGYEYGVVLNYQCTGITGTSAPYDNGTSATHLVAHSFNLNHIWGDATGCLTDDGCADTPLQDDQTTGIPSAPLYDACTTSGNGIMFMNFMNYVDDIAYANFTPDQAARMQACFTTGGPLESFSQLSTCTANAGPDITVCGLSATLAAVENTGDINTHWLPNVTNIFTDINSPTTTVLAPTIPGVYSLIWQVTNSAGITCTDTVKVTFTQQPVANAGVDTSVCGKSYDLEGILSNANNSGIWTMALNTPPNPGSANFSPPTSPTATVTVTEYGWYLFIWKEMNANNTTCFDIDTVRVEIKVVPMPDAGLDITVCGSWAHICATPSVTGGQWSGPAGIAYYDIQNGTYTPSQIDSACTWIRYPSENDSVTMYWFESNGVCTGYDSVNVYFASIQPAISLVASSDSVVCGADFNLLNAQQLAYGYGYWQDTVQNTIFSPSQINVSPIVTINTNSFGYHDFYWITVNGICRDTSSVVRVNFKTNKIEGIAQSSLVTDFSNFKAELFNDVSYQNIPFSNCNLTSSGSFSLWAEPNQNYYLKLSKINSLLYPGIANSYYNSSYNWDNATLLTATGSCDTIAVNVPLLSMTQATGGQCRIYGLVRYDGSLAPVANATVYLRYQPNQDPARFELTNQNGYYSINNIPNGNYKLYVDMPGLPQVTNHHIVINSNDTVFANVNFIVDTTSIHKDYGFGIYADTTGFIGVNEILVEKNNFICFPNPASDYIKIILNSDLNEISNLTIYNIEGKIVAEKLILQPETTIKINNLNSGVYTIEIKNGKFIKREKIIKL